MNEGAAEESIATETPPSGQEPMRLARWWRQLDRPQDTLLLVRMQLWLVGLLVAGIFRPLRALVRMLRPRHSRRSRASDERCEALARYARFVVWLNHLWARNPCLYQCLLLYRFLRLEGRDAEAAFGLQREGDTLKGHTWILLDGRVFDDTEEHVGRYELMWTTAEPRT